MGFVLFLIALMFFPILFVWGMIETIVSLFYKRTFFKGLGVFSGLFLTFALIIDITINVVCKVPLNRWFRTSDGYEFGEVETISRALGINQRDGTLSKVGDKLCRFLDFIDKDHCKNSI